MKRVIKVFVGDEARWVGTLHYDAVGSRERSAFTYADTWLLSATRAVETENETAADLAYLRGRGTSLDSSMRVADSGGWLPPLTSILFRIACGS
jgi:serine/threonine-protein kinase HipA